MKNNSTVVGDIYDHIDTFAPFDTQCEWDNSGLLIGDREAPVDRAMICLDAAGGAIERALEERCELIITHHPVIFRPLRSISPDSAVYRLIRADRSVISAHTNLDISACGVNHCLANVLELEDIHPVDGMEMGFGGTLRTPLSCEELAAHVSEKLRAGCRFAPIKGKIKKIAVVGGAGGDMAEEAFSQGYDAFITGEAKHHEFIAAAERGGCLIAAGHYETEAVVLDELYRRLSARFPNVTFILYKEKTTHCFLSATLNNNTEGI